MQCVKIELFWIYVYNKHNNGISLQIFPIDGLNSSMLSSFEKPSLVIAAEWIQKTVSYSCIHMHFSQRIDLTFIQLQFPRCV